MKRYELTNDCGGESGRCLATLAESPDGEWVLYCDVEARRILAIDMANALDSLLSVVGLTAFKHEGQRQILQQAFDLASAMLRAYRAAA